MKKMRKMIEDIKEDQKFNFRHDKWAVIRYSCRDVKNKAGQHQKTSQRRTKELLTWPSSLC